MGVDITTYLLYGIKVKLKDFKEDIFERIIDEIEGSEKAKFDAIYDQMGGDYLVLGKIIAQTDRFDEKFNEIKTDSLPNVEVLLNAINEKLGTSYVKKDFKLLFFNHFW